MSGVALVHDYLTQRGGAERVALEIARAFPGATLYTTVYTPQRTYAGFSTVAVRSIPWLGRIPFARSEPRLALPLLPLAVKSLNIDADVVLCSTSGWGHGVRSRGVKIAYCHNPARWLYQPDAYFAGLPRTLQRLVSLALTPLRRWDAKAAASCDVYLANSANVAARIEQNYGRTAAVVHPPRGLEPDGPQVPVAGVQPGYYLTVSRRRGYKRSADVARAFASGDRRLVQVGGGAADGRNITRLAGLSDAELRWLYANARALIAVGDEDFGLTPVEGYAFGIPAVVLAAGGYLETSSSASTVMVANTTVKALQDALSEVEARDWDGEAIRRHANAWAPAAFHARLREVVQSVVDVKMDAE